MQILQGEMCEITLRSILISGMATLISSSWSIPMALAIISTGPRLREAMIGLFNSFVGMPAVLVGLLIYAMLSHTGPLGPLNILYTPYAIILGGAILITPLMVSLLYEAFRKVVDEYWELAMSLGATKAQALCLSMREASPDVLIALLISFLRAIGELGVALLVGGNIKGHTRVITTSIALAIEYGRLDVALHLGLILISVVAAISLAVRILRSWLGR